ncbi:hypothetical protein M2138_000283 [Dysgonomonadaceae bacterium PH5-43]|nr:hypothetical protein [Dysgonomonadaceae bacterium PH5-43]
MFFYISKNNILITFLLCVLLSFSYAKAQDNVDIVPDSVITTNTVIPTINPYLLTPMFDGKFSFDSTITLPKDSIVRKTILDLPQKDSILSTNIYVLGKTPFREKAYRKFISENPDKIKHSHKEINEIEQVEKIKPNLLESIFKVEPEDIEIDKSMIDENARYTPKIRYWIVSGSNSLKITQTEISDNWSSGGSSNFNLLSIQNMNINYKKNKIKFNNFIEWKLSLNKSKDEKIKVGEDLFRTYSDFGIRAFNDKWYYSSNLEIKTQLFAHSKGNPKEYTSNFFSPTQINMGIFGMKYENQKKFNSNRYKKYKLTIDVSPLTVQSKWIFDDDIKPTRHGIDEGKKHKIDLGSSINSKYEMTVNRQLSFSSRFKFFTNYERVLIESENNINFALTQYFSVRLFIYAIFDDSKKKDDDLGFFQLNQVLSFGFDYKW